MAEERVSGSCLFSQPPKVTTRLSSQTPKSLWHLYTRRIGEIADEQPWQWVKIPCGKQTDAGIT